jgi:hypothetical protein
MESQVILGQDLKEATKQLAVVGQILAMKQARNPKDSPLTDRQITNN